MPALDFFQTKLPQIIADAFQGASDLPLIKDALAALPIDKLTAFSSLEQTINGAIQNLTAPSAIAAALQHVPGVSSAAIDPNNGNIVNITIHASDTIADIDLADPAIDISKGDLFKFNASADFHGTLTPTLDVTLAFNTQTGDVAIVDNPTTHAASGAHIDFGVLANGISASAELGGVIGAEATDNAPNDPIVKGSVGFTFDSSGHPTAPTLTADAKLDFHLVTTTLPAFDPPDHPEDNPLPRLYADLDLTWGYDSSAAEVSAPDIKFDDAGIDVKSLLLEVEDIIGPVADFFDQFPFGTIIDALSDPIPVIGPLIAELGKVDPALKGPIPLPDGDDVFNLLDVIALKLKSDAALNNTDVTPALTELSEFAVGLSIIQYLRGINDAIKTGSNFGQIELLKGFDLADLQDPTNIDPSKFIASDTAANLLATLSSDLGPAAADLLSGALDAYKNITAFIRSGDNPLSDSFDDPDVVGLSFPVFQHPEELVAALFGGAPASIVQFDLPRLGPGPQQFGPYVFNVLGPIAIELHGAVDAAIDFAVGYDTNFLNTGDLKSGIYLTTGPTVDGHVPHLDDETHGFMPAAYVWSDVEAGLGVGLSDIGGVFFQGGLTGNVDAFFNDDDHHDDGKVHYDSIAGGCIFEPVEGKLTIGISAVITIGISDFFSWSKEFTIASATLIDFSFGCDGSGTLQTDPLMGLATVIEDNGQKNGVTDQGGDDDNGPDLRLNAGEFSDKLSIHNMTSPFGPDESFFIHNALDDHGNPVAGMLTVTASTITEAKGSSDHPLEKIVADFADGNDSLTIDPGVSQAAEIQGGAGNDYIATGGGSDLIYGGDGDDQLIGGAGNDTLNGGTGNDYLQGGPGADHLVGGDGQDKNGHNYVDQVTYEPNQVGVTFYYDDATKEYVGSGGEADGDTLVGIEYIVGSHFDDVLLGNKDAGGTLEGLDGNDILLGGKDDDYLIGGPGGDWIDGAGVTPTSDGGHGNATSYLGSLGQVHIDLQNKVYYGGDADGDTLINIQVVQGSLFDDVLIGTSESNILDGFLGDDIIQGNGGKDTLIGGAGNDTIFAGGGGDTLDGGTGVDLLSYRDHPGVGLVGVTVNLELLQGADGDTITPLITQPFGHPDFHVAGTSTFENLDGSAFNDSLTGDFGDNIIRGLAGIDTLNGDAGNDVLKGGSGADHLNGGIGIDWADYATSAGVDVNLRLNFGLGGEALGDTFEQVENLRGTAFADVLTGDAGNNEIAPGLSSFSDTFDAFSAPGIDTHEIDHVDGGSSIDPQVPDADMLDIDYSLSDYGSGLVGGYDLNSSENGSFRRMDAANTQLLDGVDFANIEQLNVIGTIQSDTIYGGVGGDLIVTGAGDDTIYTGVGIDQIFAGEGNDTVISGTGIDRQFYPLAGVFFDQDNNPHDYPIYLDGGAGIDTLSISLGGVADDITLKGAAPGGDNSSVFLFVPGGATIVNFELLGRVLTGSGDDDIEQAGYVDNIFDGGGGDDIIAPGLGSDIVDGGRDAVFDRVAQFLPPDPGDLLKLDYSSFTGSAGVNAIVFTVTDPDTTLHTNSGVYRAGQPGDANFAQVTFTGIERINAVGSNSDDTLVGTFDTYDLDRNVPFFNLSPLRGDDVLSGGKGNDTLIGNTGDDVLNGGDGNDYVVGTDPNLTSTVGPSLAHVPSEIDQLTGGLGADTFALGNQQGYFYASTEATELDPALSNRAVIEDFNPDEDGDRIDLYGSASNYFTANHGGDTLIYRIVPTSSPQLIGEIKGFTGFDLNANYVEYVDATHPHVPPPNPPATDTLSALSVSSDIETLSGPAIATPFVVNQTANPSTLLQALFPSGGLGGIDHSQDRIDLVGDARAFGTFSGDPFGLGQGIVLSTGQVDDLVGPNTKDGGLFPPAQTALTFHSVGQIGTAAVMVADISSLNIASLTLTDANTKFGGGGGMASGFDLDSIFVSTKLLTAADLANINNPLLAPKLDVFDFSPADTIFHPGTQRPADADFANGPDLFGSIGGASGHAIVLDSIVNLGNVGDLIPLSLGDGGSIGFNLTQALPTTGPLYLYVAENGGNGESLDAAVNVSNSRLNSAASDMSTDFGLPGSDGDTTSLTYHFTMPIEHTGPGPVDNEIVFNFVLFSEEIREFAGSDFNDSFKILLNGVNLARLSDGAAATVNSLMASPFSIPDSDLILNPVGTGPAAGITHADAYTKVLTFEGPVNPGQNTLTIEVADARDGLLDSGILVQGGTLHGAAAVVGSSFHFEVPYGPEGEVPRLTPGNSDTFHLRFDINAPSGGLLSPVTVTFTPGAGLDLGAGEGVPLNHTFSPGGPLFFDVPVQAHGDSGNTGPSFTVIDVTTASLDPAYDHQPIAPVVLEIEPAPAQIAISDVAKVEGQDGTTDFVFTVVRVAGGDGAFSVNYATANGTATAGQDYFAKSGMLSFAEGEYSKTISVRVNGDTTPEANEQFFLNLTSPTNGTKILDGRGVATIANDDPPHVSNPTVDASAIVQAGGDGPDALTGGPGVNGLVSYGGNDILDGGPGADVLIGGKGDDLYLVDNVHDKVIEKPGEGTDTVKSSVSYTLAANVENLTLTGAARITGTGNELNNVLTGNSAGSALRGLDGNDTYIVANVHDKVFENTDEGTDTVKSSVSYTLPANVERLILTGHNAIDGTGNGQDNRITGNDGNNVLAGLGGADVLEGGGGIDTASYAASVLGVTVSLATGMGSAGDAAGDILIDIDNVTGSKAGDTIEGNGGNNVLNGGAGNDTVSYQHAKAGVTVNLSLTASQHTHGAGNDTLSGFENLTGSAFNDVLTGSSGNNTLIGLAGADLLDGGKGADTMFGGVGGDTYVVDSHGDVVNEIGGNGVDTVRASVSFDLSDATHAIGKIENLTLTGTSNINGTGNALVNTIVGNSGDNVLDGRGGADILKGGGGNDSYIADNGHDQVIEGVGAGTDTVKSSVTYKLPANVERLILTGHNDIDGTGNALDNRIIGNDGDNVLAGLGGADVLEGGGGNDTASYVASVLGVTVSLAIGVGSAGDAAGDILIDIDNVDGSKAADIIEGNSGNNVLRGEGGNDTVSYQHAKAGVTVDLGVHVAQNTHGAGIDTLSSFENVTGSAFNDTLTGSSDDNTLVGLAGADLLDGGTGADTMFGGIGDDTYVVDSHGDVVNETGGNGVDTVRASVSFDLSDTTHAIGKIENLTLTGTSNINGTGNALANTIVGNSGINVLNGGAGNDRLDGGGGADILTGGAGHDTFVFNTPGNGVDTIKDFAHVADALEISAAGFGGGLAANAPVTLVTAASAAAASGPAGGYFIFDNAGANKGTLYWDADGGSGSDAVAVATLHNVTSLLPSDFHVV